MGVTHRGATPMRGVSEGGAKCAVYSGVLVGVQVSVVGETVNVTGQSSVTPVKVPACRLSDELSLLFDRAAFSDVTLVVADRQFHVHKAILAGTTHTRPFSGPLSGTTRVSRYQKGKTNLDFTEARDSQWQ